MFINFIVVRNEQNTEIVDTMLARSLFNLQSRFTFPWASWLGCRSALHPVAEMGGFVAVEKNK